MHAKKVRELIGNEIWQATGTGALKVEDFKKLDEIIGKLSDAEDRQDFKEICLEAVSDSKSPIAPRYLATLCGKHPVDDVWAFGVFDEYYRDNKWNVVIYLAQRLLTFTESPYVLKALAESYRLTDEEEKRIQTLEKLIKTDHTETDAFYVLAENCVKNNDLQGALNLYRRVVQRHIVAGDLIAIKDVWPKVLELKADNTDLLIQLCSKIAKTLGNEKAVYFLNEILIHGDIDTASKIKVLKKVLEFAQNNKEAMSTLVSLYKDKYKDNPRLDFCLENTGMLSNYLDATTAIQKFEKEIEFVEGAFVFHNTWKLGRIRKIEQDSMEIQFLCKKELHKMSCNMAFSSLKILPKQHIMVLKAGVPADKIREKILDKTKTEWSLKMLLNSFNGQASFKQIKAELVPSILNESDWTTWFSYAKKELDSNPYFSTSEESNDIYVLRDTPITFEEKNLLLFTREKGFFNKLSILKEFVKKSGNTDSEEFASMLKYFETETKSSGWTSICSYMVLNEYSGNDFKEKLLDIIKSISVQEITQIYKDINDSDLRKKLVDLVNEGVENPTEILIAFLHACPSSFIVDSIRTSSRKMNSIIVDSIENYTIDPDLTLYFFKNCTESDWKKANLDKQDILSSKLELLIHVSERVSHKVDAADNRQRQKQLFDMLWGNKEIINFLSDCDTNSSKRIFSYVNNIPDLDDDKKIGIKHYILSNRSDAESICGNNQPSVEEGRRIPKGFLCTRSMFNSKTAELEHIMNVEIPENSKDIGTARDLGDLRENAEYQYAKDKQKNLNFMMNKLTDEIDIAKIVDPADVDLNYVEFGVKVVFTDNLTKKNVEYTVLGPWESNPEKNILNFQAPLGNKIYNMQKGENKKFEINGVKYDLTVKSIELADFNQQ